MPKSYFSLKANLQPKLYEFKKYNSNQIFLRSFKIQKYMLNLPFNVHDGLTFKSFRLSKTNTDYIGKSLFNLVLTKPIGYKIKTKKKTKK